MRFRKRLQQPGARGTRPGHHHGSDTPASARAILHHTDQKGPNILTGVYACCINQSYQSIFFHKKYRKLLILKKSVFLSLPFLDFFSKDFFFFASSPCILVKDTIKDVSKFWWLPCFLAKNYPIQTFQSPVQCIGSNLWPQIRKNRCGLGLSFFLRVDLNSVCSLSKLLICGTSPRTFDV